MKTYPSEDEISQEEKKILQAWYKKRTLNLIVTFINGCLYNFEYAVITISALYYFKDTIKVSNPALYYSLATGAMFVLDPISSIMVGKYTDRTRNVRKVALILAFFNIAGNLLYSFPFFDWIPIVGRLLCGIPDGIKAAYLGK